MAVAAKRVRKTPAMTLLQVRSFLEALAQAYPDAASELDYTDAYSLLVSVVLSAQTTDVAVNRVGRTLFAAAPTPAAMVALGAEGIAPHIRSIGLWQAKAKNVAALSALLLERHGGIVPQDREALEGLPGVGRKTANVVMNVAFGLDTMAVDTHVFRLGNRTGIAPARPSALSRTASSNGSRKRCSAPPTTGSSCTAATSAKPAAPNASAAPPRNGAASPEKATLGAARA